MCFFCSENLRYGFNFPEGLLSQLRLRLVIENVHVSLTDPCLQSEQLGEGAREAESQDSCIRMATS